MKSEIPKKPSHPMEKRSMYARYPHALTIILIFFSLCLIGAVLAFYIRERTSLRDAKLNELSSILDLKINQIAEWKRERFSDANFIYNNEQVALNFAEILAHPNHAYPKRRTNVWMSAFFKNGNYTSIALFDTIGNPLLSVGEFSGRPLRQEFIRSTRAERDVHFSDFYVSSRGRPVLAVVVPILDGGMFRNHLIGFARFEIDPEHKFYPLLQSWVTLSTSAEILLLRSEGDSIVYLNELVYAPHSALKMKMSKSDTMLAGVKGALGFTGGFEGYDYRQKKVLASARRVPDTQWYIVIKQDADEVYALMNQSMLVSTGLIAVILVLMGFVVRSSYVSQKKESDEIRQRFEQERKFRAIFESVPASLWETDWGPVIKAIASLRAEGVRDFRTHFKNDPQLVMRWFRMIRIIDVNRATLRMFEAPSNEEFMSSLESIFTPEAFSRFEEALIALAEGKESFAAEVPLRTLTTAPIHVLFTLAFPPTDPDSTIVLYSLADISENKKNELRILEAQRELKRANKDLESFTYSVSHDLRAPLRAIHGFAKILTEDFGGELSSSAHRYISLMQSNAKGMGELIDDLLTFSRISRSELKVSPVPMKDLIDKVISTAVADEDRSRITISVGELHNCVADPSMMMQVWTNLITNAVKFSAPAERPAVSIDSEVAHDEITYMIRDNGVGFDMKYADKLFNVFQRLHDSSTFPGTGVGLAIVKRIVTKHGGSVHAEGGVGKGATISFTLPLRKE